MRMLQLMKCAIAATLFQVIVAQESTTKLIKPVVCDDKCWDGHNCDLKICSGCFYACPEKTCRYPKNKCEIWCVTVDDCSKPECNKCRFCPDTKSNSKNSTSQTCPIATFQDKTSILFSNSSEFWNQWKHSAKPYFHEGAPSFFDLNGDNVLDYFNSMHGHNSTTFLNRMELGLASPSPSNSSEYTLYSISDRIINTDEHNSYIDTHGQVISDLDGDGHLDILISNGGGQFAVNSSTDQFDNWLFWGESAVDNLNSGNITIFKGGRNAARSAGVEMKMGRGRFNYLLDANGDGLLDIFSLQDRRAANYILPGVLLINQGNRTWKKDYSFMEYSRTMMVTDADGDGFAREFLLNRAFCYPQRPGPGIDESQKFLGPYSQDIKQFCNSRPVGTNAVYKFKKSSNRVTEISKPYTNFWAAKNRQKPCCENGSYDGANDCNALSMASGDFDKDEIADHILLYSSKLVFFFSSDRKLGVLPENAKNIGLEIKLPQFCRRGLTVRVVDFDNDGKEEIMVGCQNAGVFLLYVQGSSKLDWSLDKSCNGERSLGDLGLRSLATPTSSDMSDFCTQYNGTKWGTKDEVCQKYEKDEKTTFTKLSGVAIVDINNDGFLDIVTTNNFGYLRFFHNIPSPQSSLNRFISFKLIGDIHARLPNNYYGIGATVILSSLDLDRNNKEVKQFREISSFQHTPDRYGSKEDRIIFGLGQNLVPDRITIRWPNGKTQELSLALWNFTGSTEPIEIIDRGNWEEFILAKDGENLCMGVGEGTTWKEVKLFPCLNAENNIWMMDLKGRIRSKRFPNHCIGPSGKVNGRYTKVDLLHCWSAAETKSWFFTSQGEILYGGSSFSINVIERADGILQFSPIGNGSNASWNKIPLSQFKEE